MPGIELQEKTLGKKLCNIFCCSCLFGKKPSDQQPVLAETSARSGGGYATIDESTSGGQTPPAVSAPSSEREQPESDDHGLQEEETGGYQRFDM